MNLFQWVKSRGFVGLGCLSATLLVGACAGPTTPFGAVDQLAPPSASEQKAVAEFDYSLATQPLVGDGAALIGQRPVEVQRNYQFKVLPDRHVYHQSHPFQLNVIGEELLTDTLTVKVLYNGRNITSTFLKNATRVSSEDGKRWSWLLKSMRMPPNRDHFVEFVLEDENGEELLHSKWLPPVCDYQGEGQILSTGPFQPPKNYLNYIQGYASKQQINPLMVTGLIAQESGFRPEAISWAKAIGLTQVTTLAEKEVHELHKDFPRYEEIAERPVPFVKALIVAGEINKSNEWRLNPRHSINGGVTFLRRLLRYWNIPSHQDIVAGLPQSGSLEKTRILLASYNSGASRVKRAIIKHGENWLKADNLGEARKYVGNISSYCHHFGKKGLEL